MAGEDAELAFLAGHVDLVDLAGENQPLGRHELEVESGHLLPVEKSVPVRLPREPQRDDHASAASRLPFSTACSMVPTM